jgi:hypothetical protein
MALAGACVASVEPAEDVAPEAISEVESTIEATPAPLCPDIVRRLQYSKECFTPRGEGFAECTDTITFHRTPVFKVTGMECKTTDTTVTTHCGMCVVLELPDPDPGDELPF